MTRQILPITFLLCLLLTGSCKEDTYVYPDVITEFIDIQTDGSGTITQLAADNGRHYRVQPREGLDGLRADTIYRTVSIYQFLTENASQTEAEVMLYSSSIVISPYPAKASEWKDSIYTDPVDIQSIWRSGDYLNLIAEVKRKDQSHAFHFIEDSITTDTQGIRTLYLRLYHNSNHDYEVFTDPTYLSVPLRLYRDTLHTGDKIRFYLNTYKEGITYREFTY